MWKWTIHFPQCLFKWLGVVTEMILSHKRDIGFTRKASEENEVVCSKKTQKATTSYSQPAFVYSWTPQCDCTLWFWAPALRDNVTHGFYGCGHHHHRHHPLRRWPCDCGLLRCCCPRGDRCHYRHLRCGHWRTQCRPLGGLLADSGSEQAHMSALLHNRISICRRFYNQSLCVCLLLFHTHRSLGGKQREPEISFTANTWTSFNYQHLLHLSTGNSNCHRHLEGRQHCHCILPCLCIQSLHCCVFFCIHTSHCSDLCTTLHWTAKKTKMQLQLGFEGAHTRAHLSAFGNGDLTKDSWETSLIL